MPPPSPAELRALRSKDKGALASVIEENAGVLYNAALGLGLPPADAEELVQESFTTFLSAVGNFEGRSTVRTFLFGILYNKARKRWEKSWREEPTDPVDQVFESRFDAGGVLRRLQGPEEENLNRETAAIIEECAKGLSQAQRAAFFLKEVDRQETAAICNILDVTRTHLGVLLFRAKNRLRECLEKKWGTR